MRHLVVSFLVGLAACADVDQTIDITHDACAPLAVITSPDASLEQTAGITTATALWRARGAPRVTANAGRPGGGAIEVQFEAANPAVFGLYDDESGLIYINNALAGEALAIVIAHELGHAFGLVHASGYPSVMTKGNVTTPPTEGDQIALETLWGRCTP